MKDHYNPYEDPTLKLTKPEETNDNIDEVRGFNDVISYFDIINGHPVPKKSEDLPKRFRKLFKFLMIAAVVYFVFATLWNTLAILFTS
ncbi:MAG: hypothetical protein ACO1OC_03990 [Tuberibacillus sp.]